MNSKPLIGVLGGYGAVGQAACRLLKSWGLGRLRVGGRRVDEARRFVDDQLGGAAEAVAVDVYQPQQLSDFCAGCRVVLNCAGPSYQILDRVANAAFTAGSDYVDPGGDDPLFERLAKQNLTAARRIAVLTAGMGPGLSGLLPRWLARQGFERIDKLTAYVGGRGRLTVAGAADYILSLGNQIGESLAAWRGGRVVSRALEALTDADLPFFPAGVRAHPFISTETERLARALGLSEVHWYNVFDGDYLLGALGRVQGAMVGKSDLSAAVAELCRAAELDLFAKQPYQLFVLTLEGEADGRQQDRTVMLRAVDAQELTGAVSALAVSEVLSGNVPAGVHFAADVLEPELVTRLRDTPAVTALELMDVAVASREAVEEGAL